VQAAAASSACTTTHGTAGSGMSNGRPAGLHAGLAAMLTPSMFASAMETDPVLPATAAQDRPVGESAVQPADTAESSVPVVSAASAPAPVPMCVDTANQALQGNRASSTLGQGGVPAMHANLVAMLSPAAGPVLAQGLAPAAAASTAHGSAPPPTVSLPPAMAASLGVDPAATAAAAASSPLKRRRQLSRKERQLLKQQGSAFDASASDSESPPLKVPRPSTDRAGSAGIHPALMAPPPPVAASQQQRPGPQCAEEDELTEVQGPSDDSSDESDSGSSPAAHGSAKKQDREPYRQVWRAW
jgi:hypothetical protein